MPRRKMERWWSRSGHRLPMTGDCWSSMICMPKETRKQDLVAACSSHVSMSIFRACACWCLLRRDALEEMEVFRLLCTLHIRWCLWPERVPTTNSIRTVDLARDVDHSRLAFNLLPTSLLACLLSSPASETAWRRACIASLSSRMCCIQY